MAQHAGSGIDQFKLSDSSEVGDSGSIHEEGEPKVFHVVLVSGDVVTVTQYPSGRRSFAVQGTERNEGFAIFTIRNETYVVPQDANLKKLDLSLFNIDYLISEEYFKLDVTPLLISSDSKDSASKLAKDPDVKGFVSKVFKSVPAIAAKAKFADIRKLYKSLMKKAEVAKVRLDMKLHATLNESLPIIGLPNPANPVWGSGYTGEYMKIGIIDTGIDPTHPDVGGPRIVAAQDFTDDGTVDDLHGHGTHVAAIAAGSAAASTSATDPNGKFKGVAWGASLINAKVLNRYGWGYWSWVIAGIEWSVEQGADVINLSIGDGWTDGNDPPALAVDAAVDAGVVACVAAGNSGGVPWHYFTVETPGSARKAITVGAIDKSGNLAWFSSRGPVTGGEIRLKPDVVAPGVSVYSAHATNSPSEYAMPNPPPLPQNGPPNYPPYYTWGWSGTSMATPHVAGLSALVLQAHPGWEPWHVKDAIMNTAVHLDGCWDNAGGPSCNVYQEGTGRIVAPAAVFTTALLDEPSYSFGIVTDEATHSHSYKVYNYGASAITVTLSVTLTDVGTGTDWTAGHASTTPQNLNIPAGQSQSFTLDVNMAGMPLSLYSGVIVASVDGFGPLRSAFGFAKMNTLTVTKIDMAGDLAEGHSVWKWKVNPSNDLDYWINLVDYAVTDSNGQVVLYHTNGNYNFVTLSFTTGEGSPVVTIAENLAVTGNGFPATLDERTTNKVDLDPNESGQTIAAVRTQVYYQEPNPNYYHWWFYMLCAYPASTESWVSTLSSSWWVTFGYNYYPSSDYDLTDMWTVNTGEWHDLLYANKGVPGLMHFIADYSSLVWKWSVYPVNLGPNAGAHRWANTWSRLFDDPSTGFIPWWYWDWTFSWKMSLPQARMEYLSPDVWYDQCLEKVSDIPWQGTSGWFWHGPYSAWSGGTPEERWNTAFSNQLFAWVDASDPGDHLELSGHAIMDGWRYGGHSYHDYGRSPAGTLELTGPGGPLFSGSVYDEFDWRFLPQTPGVYTATLDATSTQQLSTHMIATYKFDTSVSGTILPSGQIDVPQINFEPQSLNLDNTAPAGKVTVGIRARSWSDPETPMSSFKAWYSIDDGLTWNSLTVNPSGTTNYYLVELPALSDKYVSLRAEAINSLGNSIEQRTIRAFYMTKALALGDLVVWRPSSGRWYVRHQDGSSWTQQWGTNGDVPFVADVDSDGLGDLILWRPSNGHWYVLQSSKSYSPSQALRVQWGTRGDTPLVADVDGDGRADLIVWRPSNGYWCALKSTTNYDRSKALWIQWGASGDKPLVGRFDSDARADLIVWRPSNGYWYVLKSSTGYSAPQAFRVQWGVSTDKPLVGDVDGDGLADLIVWRPSNGYWYALQSTKSYSPSQALRIQWGTSTDKPLVGAYDSDGRVELVVWRPSNGVWYVLKSTASYDRASAARVQWGTSGDRPLMMGPLGCLWCTVAPS
jgi:subtilisin family serine protease